MFFPSDRSYCSGLERGSNNAVVAACCFAGVLLFIVLVDLFEIPTPQGRPRRPGMTLEAPRFDLGSCRGPFWLHFGSHFGVIFGIFLHVFLVFFLMVFVLRFLWFFEINF